MPSNKFSLGAETKEIKRHTFVTHLTPNKYCCFLQNISLLDFGRNIDEIAYKSVYLSYKTLLQARDNVKIFNKIITSKSVVLGITYVFRR